LDYVGPTLRRRPRFRQIHIREIDRPTRWAVTSAHMTNRPESRILHQYSRSVTRNRHPQSKFESDAPKQMANRGVIASVTSTSHRPSWRNVAMRIRETVGLSECFAGKSGPKSHSVQRDEFSIRFSSVIKWVICWRVPENAGYYYAAARRQRRIAIHSCAAGQESLAFGSFAPSYNRSSIDAAESLTPGPFRPCLICVSS
jgi:hypothetical protein